MVACDYSLSAADWEKALKLLVEAVVNDSVYYEPVKQLMTVPVRQIMNQSVQPYLKLLVLVVYQIVEMMKRDTHKVTVDFIRSLLPTPNTLRAATSGGSALGASQNLLAKGTKETLEEVVESAAKSSTTQVVKITAKAAAKQAARSALIMGGAVDTCIFAVRTYNDLSQAEEGNISSREFKKRLACNAGSAVGSTTVGAAGAATGAAIGTVILPGIGTAIGAIVGNIIGGTAGSYTGRYIGDQLSQYSAD